MPMMFNRHERYRGRSPYTLPLFYACAECGGTIRCVIKDGGGFSVTCRTDDKHDGLKPLEGDHLARVTADMLAEAEKHRQLTQIAEVSPRVEAYLKEKRRVDKQALFGED